MQLFWSKGYAATGMAELQAHMGIGRKSLYDTFGNKRELFIKALQLYMQNVAGRIFSELNRQGSPLGNVRRLMRNIQEQHSDPHSKGCLLGVSMAQFRTDDEQMADILCQHTKSVEEAYYKVFQRAREAGELNTDINNRDLARLFMGVHQGLALLGRVQVSSAVPKSIVKAALAIL